MAHDLRELVIGRIDLLQQARVHGHAPTGHAPGVDRFGLVDDFDAPLPLRAVRTQHDGLRDQVGLCDLIHASRSTAESVTSLPAMPSSDIWARYDSFDAAIALSSETSRELAAPSGTHRAGRQRKKDEEQGCSGNHRRLHQRVGREEPVARSRSPAS